MKRKFFTLLLVAATTLAGTFSLTSCKDYDSDAIAQLEDELSEIEATLQKQIDAISQCDCSDVDLSNYATISALNLLQDELEAQGEVIDKYQPYWEELAEISSALLAEGYDLSDLKAYIDDRDALAYDYVDGQVASLEEAYAAADADLQEQLDALQAQVDALTNKYASLITSINIDKVSNPIFGSLNLPFGIKSTVLCAWYGENGPGTDEFPTTRSSYYANEDEAEWAYSLQSSSEKVEIGSTIVNPYAGTVLLTINPNDIDFEGVKVTLASRADDSAPVAFEDEFTLEASTKAVTTRSSSTGAYDAVVKLSSTDADDLADAQIDVDEKTIASELASVVKKIVNTSNTIDVLDVAQTLYSNFKSAIPEYYAIKAEWNDGDTDRSVRSDYEIAAFTAKPLSYSSLASSDYSGYFETLTSKIPQIEELGWSIELDEVSLDEEVYYYLTIPVGDDVIIDYENSTLTIVRDSEDTVIDFYSVEDEGDYYLVKISVDGLASIVDSLNETISNVESQINDLVEQINSSYIGSISTLLSNLNNSLSILEKYAENPNKLLQPVLFYVLDGNYGRLSQVKNAPSVFNVSGSEDGVLSLVASSFTADLLAPAYKKYVQVNLVSGTSGSYSITDGENSGRNLLIDGNDNAIVFTGQAGSTYAITYSAVDYYGYVTAKTYYVKIQ